MNKQSTLLICVETVDLDDRAYGFFNDWLVELEKQQVKAIVVCLRKGRMSVFREHEILVLPQHGSLLALRRLFALWRISWNRRGDYAAVFVRQSTVYVMAVGWLWRLFGKRIIMWYAHYKGRWDLNIAARIAHAVVTSVPEACRCTSREPIIIGQSIDTERFHIPEGKIFNGFRVLVLGRVSPVKKVDEIIDTFEASAFTETQGSLTIIGKPGNEDYGKKIGALIQDDASIQWVREGLPYDALPEALEAYDFLMNFYKGSLDKAILECMSSGIITLISTDSAEKLLPGSLHWLIARSDDERRIALGKLAMLSSEERRNITHQLRDIVVQNHSLTHQVRRVVELSFPQ